MLHIDRNWHQGTVFFAASQAPEDAEMKAKAPLLFLGSVAMVALQCCCALAVMISVVLPSCQTSDQCQRSGTFCATGLGNSVDGTSRCDFCGEIDEMPLPEHVNPATGEPIHKYNDPATVLNGSIVLEVCAEPRQRERGWRDPSEGHTVVSAEYVASWCASCVHPLDGSVDALTGFSIMHENALVMGYLDLAALLFSSFIVAFQVVGELKDITLCRFAVLDAGDRLSSGWRASLLCLGFVRRWVFLVVLVTTVPMLVVQQGGDALSICFNSIAILFMMEVDQIAFVMGLSERVRARVEDVGRITLRDDEAVALVKTKTVHVALIVLAVNAAVFMARWRWTGGDGGAALGVFLFPNLAFFLASCAEAFAPGASVGEIAQAVGQSVGSAIVGQVSVMSIMVGA